MLGIMLQHSFPSPYIASIPVEVFSNTLPTVENFLDMGAGPNVINNDFPLQACKESLDSDKSPQRRARNQEVKNIKGIVPFFIRMGNLSVRTRFGIVGNIAVDALLGTSLSSDV